MEKELINKKMLLTVNDLHELLGIGKHAAYSLMRDSSFPSFKIGCNYYCSPELLKDWIKKQALKK